MLQNIQSWPYQPQWTTNLTMWNNLTPGFLTGTGAPLTNVDTANLAQSSRFYRLLIRQP